MRSLIFSAALLSVASATCAYPNNTATAVHMLECRRDAENQIVIFDFVVKEQGKAVYPINSKVPFTVSLSSFNNGKPITGYTFNATIYGLKSDWADPTICVWKEMPTFVLLSNQNGCSWGKNCPLPPGDLDMLMEFDLSRISPLPSIVFSDMPVQVFITMYNNSPGSKKEEIACVAAQMKIV